MSKTIAKKHRATAERAAEHYLVHNLDCVAVRRAIRTQWQSVDFFASDVVGKRKDGSHIYAQVTAGKNETVRRRRRKLDAFPWHTSDTVLLLQFVETPDPANARRKLFFFRVHSRNDDGEWSVDDVAQPIAKDWLMAMKVENQKPVTQKENP